MSTWKVAALVLLVPAPALWAAKAADGVSFKTGQVIGISTLRDDPASLLFEGFSGSRYSHVGVISAEGDELVVYNSYPVKDEEWAKTGKIRGARVTPLPDFLKKASLDASGSPEFTLVEPAEPLSETDRRALVARMQEMVDEKTPFNHSMKLNRESVNCAEFVHCAFHHIGLDKVGEVGTMLTRMNLEAFDGMLGAVASKTRGLPRLQDFGISPTSVIHSPQMKVVHAGLPVDRILSDAELFAAWKAAGGLEVFSKSYGVPMAQLQRAGKSASRRPYRRYPRLWRNPSDPR